MSIRGSTYPGSCNFITNSAKAMVTIGQQSLTPVVDASFESISYEVSPSIAEVDAWK
jgi:hypothetical protein